MAGNELFVLGILCSVLLAANGQTGEFLSPCGANRPCPSEKFLKCIDSQCECLDPDNQIFDPIEGECVILAGSKCSQRTFGVPQCVQGAECSPQNSTCQCSKGFYETSFNICSYNIGKSCSSSGDCDTASGLDCENKMCKCRNSSYIWQLELGCVTVVDIISSVDDSNEAVTSPNTTSGAAVLPTVESAFTVASSPDASQEINSIKNNSLSDFDFLLNDTLISQLTLDSNGTDTTDHVYNNNIGDRDNFLQNLLDNSPILSLLNPPRQRIRPNPISNPPNNLFRPNNNFPQQSNFGQNSQNNNNFGSQSNYIPNNGNNNNNFAQTPQFQQQNNPQNNIQSIPQGSQVQTQPQQVSQQSQPQQITAPSQTPQQQTVLDLSQFQKPLATVQSDYDQLGSNEQNNFDNSQTGSQNPQFQTIPFIRRLLDPIKRYLFPGLANRNFRLPSPIWLAVSTINQALPVLRAIDYQVSPWLQTVAKLTKPQYIGLPNDNNINNNENPFFTGQFGGSNNNNNNYNYNNGQSQQYQNSYQNQNRFQQQSQQPPRQGRAGRGFNFYEENIRNPTRNVFF